MQQDLTTGKVLPVLIKFSIPIVLGNIFQLVYNFTDSLIVGRILGASELAGVGATGSINFLILGAASGATSGLTIFVARFFGAKDEEKMRSAIAHSIVIAAIVALLFSTASLALLRNILTWMNTPDDIFDFSYQYISVIFGGIIITLFYNLLAGILRSVGDSKTPLYFLILSSLLNIALDVLFIAVLKTGVRGAAVATVIAQAVSVVLCIVFICRKFRFLLPKRQHFAPDWPLAKDMILLGLSMGFQNSFVAVGNILMQSSLNLLGTAYVAANTAASRMLHVFMSPMNTISSAMVTFTSQNLGAKKVYRIREGLRMSLLIGLGWALFSFLLSLPLGPQMVGIFINKGSENFDLVIKNGTFFLRWNLIFFLALGPLFTYRCTLTGLGNKLVPTLSAITELIVKILFVIFIIPVYHYPAIALTEPISWVFVLAILVIFFYRNPVIRAGKTDRKTAEQED